MNIIGRFAGWELEDDFPRNDSALIFSQIVCIVNIRIRKSTNLPFHSYTISNTPRGAFFEIIS